jgi:hypothetical protein
MRRAWEGRAADEPANAPQVDELATVAQPIPQIASNLQLPPVANEPASPDAAPIAHARTLAVEHADRVCLGLWTALAESGVVTPDDLGRRLEETGKDAATVIAAELGARDPTLDASAVFAELCETFDQRLRWLAANVCWSGGRAQ